MPKRRRLATREEVLETLAGCQPDVDWAKALAALDAAGVQILLEIVVDEEV